ncbi:MAG: TonB-dependent siderophore receptor [Cytophaga sp.]|nr:TonB-dependent siderophore receptor [Cytophaga sp.]
MRIALLVLVSFSSLCALAQSGRIKGSVKTSDQQAAPYVSIVLKGTNKVTTTDLDGAYELRNVTPGSHTLSISFVGHEARELAVTVYAGQTTTVADILLTESSSELQEVVITADKGYKEDRTSASLRLTTPLMETSQNIQIVNSKLLADQQVTSMSDGVIRNVSGANRQEHWGDLYTNITMRGSQIQAFRNGFNVVASYWGPLTEDMSIVDHIEFVKGPAGFMLANGDPAGLYNVVTKKPTGQTKGEVAFTVGSFDMYRTALDLDGKLSKDGKLLYRLNVAGQNKKSFRDYEFNNRYTIAPVISYQLDEKTKLTAEYNLQYAKMSDVGSFYMFSTDGYATLPRNFSVLAPGMDPTKISDQSGYLMLEHKIDDNWKLTSQASYFHYNQTGSSLWPAAVNTDGTMIRSVGIWDAKSEMTMAQLFLNGDVQSGGIHHRILAGIDMARKDYLADWGQSHSLDTEDSKFDTKDPHNNPSNGYPDFDRSLPLEQRAGGVIGNRYSAVYIQDELGFFENRLRLTLAGRYTYAAQNYTYTNNGDVYSSKHFSPRAGLSYSVNDRTSVYALYDQAFIPQSGRTLSGNSARPVTGNNVEFGVKRDWLEGKWNTTLSIYKIIKNNELAPTSYAPNAPGVEVGKRAQGIEFDIRGELVKGLNVTANYAYTDAEVTNVAGQPVDVTITDGQRIAGSNKHTYNGWVSYKIQSGKLQGAGVSGGFTYLADRATGSYSKTNPEQNLPDYFKMDGGLFWENGKVRIAGNVFNILDKYLYGGAYYSGYFANNVYSWQAEAPRNYRVSVTYKF